MKKILKVTNHTSWACQNQNLSAKYGFSIEVLYTSLYTSLLFLSGKGLSLPRPFLRVITFLLFSFTTLHLWTIRRAVSQLLSWGSADPIFESDLSFFLDFGSFIVTYFRVDGLLELFKIGFLVSPLALSFDAYVPGECSVKLSSVFFFVSPLEIKGLYASVAVYKEP